MRQAQKHIDTLLTQHLNDMVKGYTAFDLNTLFKIKAALDHDRPTSDFIMTTILNAMTYLHGSYPLASQDHFPIILNFLEAFYHYSRAELLSTADTYKDGLSMDLPEEEEA